MRDSVTVISYFSELTTLLAIPHNITIYSLGQYINIKI